MAEEAPNPLEASNPPDWSSMGKPWNKAFPLPDWGTVLTPDQLRRLAIAQLEWEIRELEVQIEARKRVRDILIGESGA